MIPSETKGRKNTMSQSRAVGQENSLFFMGGVSLFIVVRPSAARMGPTLRRLAAPLFISSRSTFPDTPAITFGQIPGHPVRGLPS